MARAPIYAVASLALLATPLAFGQEIVWRCMQDGRAHYTNIKKETIGRDCTVVVREVSVVHSPPVSQPRPSARPANFPRVDAETQRVRDDTRRQILEEELSVEEKSLADARAKLAEQEAVRNGNERNYQKVLDRLQPYQETVERHERNVMALQKELIRLR